MGREIRTIAIAVMVACGACRCGEDPRAGLGNQSGPRFALDSGVLPFDSGFDPNRDAGGATDGGTNSFDGGGIDGGAFDAGRIDSGMSADGGMAFDSGAPFDSGTPIDSGVPPDSGVTPDAGTPDSGVVPGTGDVWIEISYVNANTPTSPRFTYSVSPGWTAASWDFRGSRAGRAEAWDRFNNMSVVNDPIGTSLAIGGSSQLQLMLGLVPLISYTGATVELEGRSRATSSRVFFDVTNPLTGCGGSGQMDQDWTPDIVQISLTGCYNPGGDVQAVRVDPTSGTIALRRMRLTLHGARW